MRAGYWRRQTLGPCWPDDGLDLRQMTQDACVRPDPPRRQVRHRAGISPEACERPTRLQRSGPGRQMRRSCCRRSATASAKNPGQRQSLCIYFRSATEFLPGEFARQCPAAWASLIRQPGKCNDDDRRPKFGNVPPHAGTATSIASYRNTSSLGRDEATTYDRILQLPSLVLHQFRATVVFAERVPIGIVSYDSV